jgi:hypothetical protein
VLKVAWTVGVRLPEIGGMMSSRSAHTASTPARLACANSQNDSVIAFRKVVSGTTAALGARSNTVAHVEKRGANRI